MIFKLKNESMKKQIFRITVVLLMSFIFNSCKKERSCTCTLTYFNSDTQTRIVPVGKTSLKQGQDACNKETKAIVTAEAPNGLSGATCEVK